MNSLNKNTLLQDWYVCRWIASRYLWSRRGEAGITVITLIAVLGVAIGVITLNMVMAVMTGFQNELKAKILGVDAHITVRSYSGEIRGWNDIESKIKSIDGVNSVSPYTYNQALLQTSRGASGVILRGIRDHDQVADQLRSYINPRPIKLFEKAKVQTLAPDTNEEITLELPSIIIGRELARALDLKIGDIVTILTPQTASTPFGLAPRFRRVVVGQIYSSGFTEYESGLAYLDLSQAQTFFRLGDRVAAFEVRVDKVDDAPQISKQIINSLPGEAAHFFSRDWTEVNAPFFEAFKLEKRVYFIVLLLIIVMASFSIVSSLIMIVLEKRKDIAILKTLGASNGMVNFIFNLQGAIIGALGVAIGSVLGFVGCILLKKYGFPIDQRIFQMSTLPVEIDPYNFALVSLCSFIICCIATIYPARRAAYLHPSEVLRYE